MLATQPLGTTGLVVTRMGLGMAALGRPGYINLGHAADLGGEYDPEAMAAQAAAVLDAAWNAGVRYFDAARSYGRGEEFLGRWLRARGLSPAECVVGSKWGYTYTANWHVTAAQHEVKDHTRATFARQIDESLALLQPFLKLYMVHSATLDSGVLERPDLLDALHAARVAGRVATMGLTLSGPSSAETLKRAREIQRDGRRLFDVVQATWNLLEPSLGPLLAECRADGMGVIVKEALANGRLTPRNDDAAFRRQRRLLEGEAQRLSCTLDQLALAAALHQPWADCVLSGAATVAQVQSNLEAATVALDAAALAALATLAEPVATYWRTRSGLAWN
jgi:aryl-alcohol dehydrogenase-like predicted oxidoreductase